MLEVVFCYEREDHECTSTDGNVKTCETGKYGQNLLNIGVSICLLGDVLVSVTCEYSVHIALHIVSNTCTAIVNTSRQFVPFNKDV